MLSTTDYKTHPMRRMKTTNTAINKVSVTPRRCPPQKISNLLLMKRRFFHFSKCNHSITKLKAFVFDVIIAQLNPNLFFANPRTINNNY